MTAISTAVGIERVSRTVGYQIKLGNFNPNTPYLPQRIALLGEANDAEKTTLDVTPYEFTSAKEVAEKYGYGSPLHIMARILRPVSGNPLGGIPTVAYPQASAVSAAAAVLKLGVAVATTVTENATHLLRINGRTNIDGNFYSYNVVKGQAVADVTTSIIDAVNNVLSAPVTASFATPNVELTTKFNSAVAILDIDVEVNGKSAGIVYSEVSNTAGTGDADIAAALALFGEKWNTLVINPYGAGQFDVLEAFNGVPDAASPTGRYTSTVFKPFTAFFGSLLSDKDDIVEITNFTARKDQVTNRLAPAPNSEGFAFEAAANLCMTAAAIYQNSPHLDNSSKSYPDMPVPIDGNIGDFSDYDNRDFMVKKGASTVNLVNDKYTVQDDVTTYAPDGEANPKFRFSRDLNVDWNYEFNWRIIMLRDIQDKAIVPDSSPSKVSDTISPKQGNQLLRSHIQSMAELALIADVAFSENSIKVEINGSNPARLDFFNRYKRTSVAHVVSADVEVDFNYQS